MEVSVLIAVIAFVSSLLGAIVTQSINFIISKMKHRVDKRQIKIEIHKPIIEKQFKICSVIEYLRIHYTKLLIDFKTLEIKSIDKDEKKKLYNKANFHIAQIENKLQEFDSIWTDVKISLNKKNEMKTRGYRHTIWASVERIIPYAKNIFNNKEIFEINEINTVKLEIEKSLNDLDLIYHEIKELINDISTLR
ncbi:MAG: hypothetical protein JXR48_18940 [Candidatus Delongbacteria bacterium]|nr:hypothetical protein [Candidatus Delongbacteria bacterium]